MHIIYTDVNGVRIGGRAKQAQIVLMRANIHAQQTQNCKENVNDLILNVEKHSIQLIIIMSTSYLPEYNSKDHL